MDIKWFKSKVQISFLHMLDTIAKFMEGNQGEFLNEICAKLFCKSFSSIVAKFPEMFLRSTATVGALGL